MRYVPLRTLGEREGDGGRILVDLLAMLRIIAAVGLLALARSESYDEDFAIDLCVTPPCLKRS